MYDVTVEPWIPVRLSNGESKKLGLLELFKTAHEIQRLDRMNAMQEYSVYRFLTLFLMATYLPYSQRKIIDILKNGCIDMAQVEAYIEKCKKEGVSFDIFDKKRPFLQSPFDAEYDSEKTIQSIAVLDTTRPCGNDPVHFDHTFIENASMTFDQAVINLLAAQIFCVHEKEGAKADRPSNVNGAPPIFFIPKGNSLFETLILSLQPVRSEPNDKENLELWRNTRKIVPEKEVPSVSEFYGMIFPARRILLIKENENDTALTKCYYRAGLNFTGYDSWKDFYVANYWDNKGKHSIKPSLTKELWRNIGTIYSLVYVEQNNHALSVVKQYQEIKNKLRDNGVIKNKNDMSMLSFGVVTNQASYLDIQRGELTLDTRISETPERVEKVQEAIQKAEEVAQLLRKILKDIGKAIKCQDYVESNIDSMIHNYYGLCEKSFFSTFSQELATANSNEDYEQCLDTWKETLRKNSLTCFDQFSNLICSTLKQLMKAEELKLKFLAILKKNIAPQKTDKK